MARRRGRAPRRPPGLRGRLQAQGWLLWAAVAVIVLMVVGMALRPL